MKKCHFILHLLAPIFLADFFGHRDFSGAILYLIPYLTPFCSDLFGHSQFYEVPFFLTPFYSEFLATVSVMSAIFYITPFGSEFLAKVIFKRCHFVFHRFFWDFFGRNSFQKVLFLSCAVATLIFKMCHFCALHRFVTLFLATPIVKIVLTKRCKIQNGPLKNDCSHKSPNQIVQDKKSRPLKITVAKKSSQNSKIQNGTSQI